MVYADYAYYTADYLGDAIPEDAFPRAALRASAKIDAMTHGKATAYALARPKDSALQSATCAVADVLYAAEKASKGATNESGYAVHSESNDGYSVTYESPKDPLSGATQGNIAMACKSAAAEYLGHTGLLYAGVTYLC